MSLAQRIRTLRKQRRLSLKKLGQVAGVSASHLCVLERDEAGAIKPSVDIVLRIADALSTTLPELLDGTVAGRQLRIPRSLTEFAKRMSDAPLSPDDLRELASIRFRGHQPQTADDWHRLYTLLTACGRRKA